MNLHNSLTGTTYQLVSLQNDASIATAGLAIASKASADQPFHFGSVVDRSFEDCMAACPAFQLALMDRARCRMLAFGISLPFYFDGDADALPDEGWGWQLGMAQRTLKNQLTPNWLGAFGIYMAPTARGGGLSIHLIDAFRKIAGLYGFKGVTAPVRPTLKCHYPLTDIGEYIHWSRFDGATFDPWLRTHLRAGGRLIGPCRKSSVVEAPLDLWELWAGYPVPPVETMLIPGALAPVTIDHRMGIGTYTEPNIWVVHQPAY
jgi:hypothetical protein